MVKSMEQGRDETTMQRHIRTFSEVNRIISSVHDMSELLGLIMHESEAAVNAQASCIALYRPEDGLLHIDFAHGDSDEAVHHATLTVGEGLLGVVAATGETMRLDAADLDPRFDTKLDHATGIVTRSLLATPIQRHGELLGVLEVINKRDADCFSENDGYLLEIVANEAAIALENNRLVERMVQAEQLSAVGKMAASMVHDFKTPLSVIRGFAEIMAEPDISEEQRNLCSTMIIEDVDRFLEMTQELLDYTRGTLSLNTRPVQLPVWLEDLADYIGNQMCPASIDLKMDFEFIGEANMDEARIRRVVQNLVVNAVDAMPDGGVLTVGSGLADDRWRLRVGDTGFGIPIGLRPRVFEPFVTQGKAHGTGLGLAVAKEIVKGHGGRLSFETRTAEESVGQEPGTTFTIDLPVAGLAVAAA